MFLIIGKYICQTLYEVPKSDRQLRECICLNECLSVTRSTRVSSFRDTGCTVIRKWNRTECAVLIWLKNTTLSGGKKKKRCFIYTAKRRILWQQRDMCKYNKCSSTRSHTNMHTATKIKLSNIMFFVCVRGTHVTYMGVISWVIPFIPELLPPEARVLFCCVCQGP